MGDGDDGVRGPVGDGNGDDGVNSPRINKGGPVGDGKEEAGKGEDEKEDNVNSPDNNGGSSDKFSLSQYIRNRNDNTKDHFRPDPPNGRQEPMEFQEPMTTRVETQEPMRDRIEQDSLAVVEQDSNRTDGMEVEASLPAVEDSIPVAAGENPIAIPLAIAIPMAMPSPVPGKAKKRQGTLLSRDIAQKKARGEDLTRKEIKENAGVNPEVREENPGVHPEASVHYETTEGELSGKLHTILGAARDKSEPVDKSEAAARDKSEPVVKSESVVQCLKDDMGLSFLLDSFLEKNTNPATRKAAEFGLSSNIVEVYLKYHCGKEERSQIPMVPPLVKGVKVEKPSEHFVIVSQDVLRIMDIVMTSCKHWGDVPTRWYWKQIITRLLMNTKPNHNPSRLQSNAKLYLKAERQAEIQLCLQGNEDYQKASRYQSSTKIRPDIAALCTMVKDVATRIYRSMKRIRDTNGESKGETNPPVWWAGEDKPPVWWAGEDTAIDEDEDGNPFVSYIPYETKKLAFLCCLVLSSATRDDDAIEATIAMHKRGILSAHAIAIMKDVTLSDIIKHAGLQRKKATTIIGICRDIVHNHDGCVPEKYEVLQSFVGIGDKILGLLWAELLHQPKAMGIDSHVIRMVDALGMLRRLDNMKKDVKSETVKSHDILKSDDYANIPSSNEDEVAKEGDITKAQSDENEVAKGGDISKVEDDKFKRSPAKAVHKALESWVHFHQYEDVNKLFGCMGQMFTQTLPLRADELGEDTRVSVVRMCEAITQHIHKPYDVALFFSVVKSVRYHYRREERPNGNKKYAGSSDNFQYNDVGVDLSLLEE